MTLIELPPPEHPTETRPRALVAYASKHGSTAEIAAAIGEALTAEGIEVDVVPVHDVVRIDDYDAIVLGSAVYIGRWMQDARRFVERRLLELTRYPVWLFSSGPIDGTQAGPDVPPVRSVAAVARRLGVRGHATFGGRVGAGMTGPIERFVIRGDWRDWDVIRTWAQGIAGEVKATAPA